MTAAARLALNWVEQGLLPDTVIRQGIRRLCQRRLDEISLPDCDWGAARTQAFIEDMGKGPLAALPEQANAQHYEVPAAFFEQVLGPRRKYSCCPWPEGVDDLAGRYETANVSEGRKHSPAACFSRG